MILEKTEVLFCYGKYPILILMKTPIVKPVGLKMQAVGQISGLPK
jgi:hypothetical protein